MNKEETKLNKIKRFFKDGTIRDIWTDWKWIFKFSKQYRRYIIIYTLLGLITSTVGLGSAFVTRLLINVIAQKQADKIIYMVIAYVAIFFISLVVENYSKRISMKISILVKNGVQKELFQDIMESKWLALNKYQNGDIENRFTNDSAVVAGNSINWIPDLVINIYSFGLTFVVMFTIDPIMAFIALLSAPFMTLVSRLIVKRMREYKNAVQEMKSEMMSFELETVYNMDVVKAFGILKNFSAKLTDLQDKNLKLNMDSNKFEIKASLVISALTFLVSSLTLGYCLFRLWTGEILFGDMTFFLSRSSALSASFRSILSMIPSIVASAVSAKRIRELMELPKEEVDDDSVVRIKPHIKNGLTVKMSNVSFSYNNKENVYENANFIARPNELIAVLGPSGEGKTTLVRLLLGLIVPEKGSVSIECSDGTEENVSASLRNLFSYVPQGNTLLSGSIADNIRIVKKDATDEEIITALKTACAWEFISKFPQGINTVIGERGKGLSEGQAQRIAIARALINDAPILIFDESTSALDEDTERLLLENVICRRTYKTCIVLTHRKRVLNQCQRIYSIKNKKTEEFLSYDDYANFIK